MSLSYFFQRSAKAIIEPFQWLMNRSPRQLLLVNNTILVICSVALSAFSLYMCALFYKSVTATSNESSGTGWMQWGGFAIVGMSLTFVCIVGIRGAKIVSLELLLFYFWGIAFFLAPLLLSTVMCFEFYSYIDVYFRHHWEDDNFLEIRKLFCRGSTASTKCKCPILGGPNYDTELEWCAAEFNGATDCEDIRKDALNEALVWGTQFTLVEASVGVLNVSEIVFSLYLCFKILTLPVIHESMNDVVNYLLAIPVAACCGLTYYLWWMRQQRLSYSWLTDFFIAMAVGLLMLVPWGVVAGRLKNMTMMTIYIVVLVLLIFGLASAGIACMLFSVVLPDQFFPTSDQAAEIACDRNLPGCCCCNSATGRDMCPEWSQSEIVQLSTLDLKLAGLVAFLCLTYLLGALVVAGVVREKLKNYKSDFI